MKFLDGAVDDDEYVGVVVFIMEELIEGVKFLDVVVDRLGENTVDDEYVGFVVSIVVGLVKGVKLLDDVGVVVSITVELVKGGKLLDGVVDELDKNTVGDEYAGIVVSILARSVKGVKVLDGNVDGLDKNIVDDECISIVFNVVVSVEDVTLVRDTVDDDCRGSFFSKVMRSLVDFATDVDRVSTLFGVFLLVVVFLVVVTGAFAESTPEISRFRGYNVSYRYMYSETRYKSFLSLVP